jgi:hypothetical protein
MGLHIALTFSENHWNGDAEVDAVYMGASSSNLITQSDVDYAPKNQIVAAGQTLTLKGDHKWVNGPT